MDPVRVGICLRQSRSGPATESHGKSFILGILPGMLDDNRDLYPPGIAVDLPFWLLEMQRQGLLAGRGGIFSRYIRLLSSM